MSAPITITLDRERRLVFDWNAICEFEDVAGESVLSEAFWRGLGTRRDTNKVIRALLWACLLDDDPTLTLREAGKLVTFTNLAAVQEKLVEAFKLAMPAAQEKSADPTPGSPAAS